MQGADGTNDGDVATGNPLPVVQTGTPTIPTGAATSAKQDTGNTSLSSIDGKITAVNTGAVVVASGSITANAGTNLNTSALATAAKQPALGTAGTASADVITVQGKASMTPVLTDGSATTQPISGTITANAGTNLNTSALALDATLAAISKAEDAAHSSGDKGVMSLAVRNDTRGALAGTDGDYIPVTTNASGDLRTETSSLAGTAIDTNSGSKSAGTQRVVLATDQPALSSKLLVTPDSVALPANQSVNVSQINGVTTTMGNGASGTGVQRVTIANDSTGIVSLTTGAATIGALTANQSVNNAQINGVTPLMGNGTTGTGSQRVTIASDNTAFSVNANAGTNLNTSALATESGGNLATIASAVHTEDVASANADKGIAVMAIRDDTLNSTSGTEGDYELLHTTADGALWVTQAPSTSNGWTVAMMSSADGSTALTNTAQAIKASAGTLGGWHIYNPNTSAAYIPIYNTAFGSVTVGTTNPQMLLTIPALSADVQEFSNGINFATAMSASAVTTGGGNGALTIALEVNWFYK